MVSLGPHIFRILARESTFMPKDVGLSHLNSEKADSRKNSDTNATCELSMDCTCMPFSLQSKFTCLQSSFMASTTFFSSADCCNWASNAMARRGDCRARQHGTTARPQRIPQRL